jgi:N-acetylglutamate synthase-like GNAT family acetyltransferase
MHSDVPSMRTQINHRRGILEDLVKLTFAKELAISPESIEFNIVGMGHEFWIAIKGETIMGLVALARSAENQFTVMYLTVASPHKRHGVGSSLLRTVLERYPAAEFKVVPFDGTQDIYLRLGFAKYDRWEMRRPPAQQRF